MAMKIWIVVFWVTIPPTLTLKAACSTETLVLSVPRNFSRGRGVIPSLAERGGGHT
jgi:hypothetical protein